MRTPSTTGRDRTARRLLVTCVVATVGLCACAGPDTGTTAEPTASEPDASSSSPGTGAGSGAATTSPSSDTDAPTTQNVELDGVVTRAIDDLSERLGPGDDIEVVLARAETFPDSAIGCPQEGEVYTQALVDGYRVVLGRDERVWLYTAGEDGVPALCPSDEKDGGRDFVPPPGMDE